jgi:hypothetical protein
MGMLYSDLNGNLLNSNKENSDWDYLKKISDQIKNEKDNSKILKL